MALAEKSYIYEFLTGIKDGEEEIMETILSLESMFPVKIQYTKEKIRNLLRDESNIHLFLKKQSLVIGYLLATPHNDAVAELKGDDDFMCDDSSCYYIDQIAVIPQERAGLTFLLLVDKLIEELVSRGVERISSHILATEKLHLLIARKFRTRLIARREIFLKIHGGAPFEYMQAWCRKK